MKHVLLLLLVVGVCLSILLAGEPRLPAAGGQATTQPAYLPEAGRPTSQPTSQPPSQPALKYPWAGEWGNEPFTEASQQPKTMTATEMMPVYHNWTYKNPVPVGAPPVKPQWRFPYDRSIAVDPAMNNVEALCARAKFTHPTTGFRMVSALCLMHALEATPGADAISLKADLFIPWDGAPRAEPEYTETMKNIIRFWRATFQSDFGATRPGILCPGSDKWPIAVTISHQSRAFAALGSDGKYKQLDELPAAILPSGRVFRH